jgi:hypothetical protein
MSLETNLGSIYLIFLVYTRKMLLLKIKLRAFNINFWILLLKVFLTPTTENSHLSLARLNLIN